MIRLARAEDIPRLQELLGQILLVHHYARPDVFKSEGSKFTDADLEAVINDSNKPIFVYEDEEGRILGHLFLMIKEVSDNNGPLKAVKTLFIDDLCVDQEARGQHIGESLFEYVKNEAKQIGCYEVTLNVWAGNTSAEKFYEKMGMRTKERQMEYIL